MDRISIFIVDDHKLIRDGIRALLSDVPSILVLGEASDSTTCLEKLEHSKPDVILMDISLPGVSGIELTRQISVRYPAIAVLILSMHIKDDFILGTIQAGAKGYLPKNTSADELVSAIHALANGEEYFHETVSRVIIRNFIQKERFEKKTNQPTHSNLSPRETEILKLYAQGLINKEIAQRLNISVRTVESHKHHIMRKMGMKSTIELVKYAIREGLISI